MINIPNDEQVKNYLSKHFAAFEIIRAEIGVIVLTIMLMLN